MGKFCSNCGAELKASQQVCLNCGTLVEKDKNIISSDDVNIIDFGSAGWGVLGFFIPLAGLIIYCIWNSTKPKTAKKAGLGALIGFIFNVVVGIICGIIIGVAASQVEDYYSYSVMISELIL